MPEIRIYICVNQLIRTNASLVYILNRLRASILKTCVIYIVHSDDWVCECDFSGLRVCFINTGRDASAYEFPALRTLWHHSQQADFWGLYLHCKGASQHDEAQWQNAISWQHYMLLGLVDHAALCLEHLQSGADLVGSQWHWHWKGNFYWFRSSYIGQLVDPFLMDQDYRNNCEHWCSYSYWWGRYPLPKIRNLFYLPLMSDSDYLLLHQKKYIPDFHENHVFTGTIDSLINQPWYGCYNTMKLSDQDIRNSPNVIAKYLNYDSMVINIDTQKIYEAERFARIQQNDIACG